MVRLTPTEKKIADILEVASYICIFLSFPLTLDIPLIIFVGYVVALMSAVMIFFTYIIAKD